jgi:type VI secretion system secreted protein VgrG
MAGENHSLRIAVQGENSLEVVEFYVTEALSQLFEVKVTCLSKKNDIDVGGLVGKLATFHLTTLNPIAPERKWMGMISRMDQLVGGQPMAGSLEQSTYEVYIVPLLWITTQRIDNRVFQQKNIPDIVKQLLQEWEIKAKWELTKGDDYYRKLDYVVQYAETDFSFICRLLERAGITFLFRFPVQGETELVFIDQPQNGPKRGGQPIPCYDEPPGRYPTELIHSASLRYSVAPGAFMMRDYEFRKQYNYALVGKSPEKAPGPESFFEQYVYEHGAFLVDQKSAGSPATPVADDRGMYPRHLDDEGKRQAELRLQAMRCRKRTVGFATNCQDLAPGVIFSMTGHPHPELGKPMMVTHLKCRGTADGVWSYGGNAAFIDYPWVPAMKTPRPRVLGAQSAIVVGPKGEEIHTDEHGRIRAQLHWDREGKYDEKASCWMRVNQDWAGIGFGKLHIPRIGHEVLLGYYDGNPDHPVVLGSVYNELNKVPYKLPDHKTKSTWKSDSSIGDGKKPGFNEIMFEDKKDEELFYTQAELDLSTLVKKYETERIGKNRMAVVGNDRKSISKELEATMVGQRYLAQLMQEPSKRDLHIEDQKEPRIRPKETCWEMIDERIIFTTGARAATVSFSDDDIRFEAAGSITVKATAGDVVIEGRHVYINDRTPRRGPRPERHRQLDHNEFSYEGEGKKGKYKQGKRELAKAPGGTPPQKVARKKIAKRFFAKNGPKKKDKQRALRDGVNLNKPVSGPNPYEPVLGQWRVPGDDKRGVLFAVPGTPPTEQGMFNEGKAWHLPGEPVCARREVLYEINPDTDYLAFEPADLDPRWLPQGVAPPEGGGAVYCIMDGADPSSPLIHPYEPIEDDDEAGLRALEEYIREEGGREEGGRDDGKLGSAEGA